jgi:hypothetical protein
MAAINSGTADCAAVCPAGTNHRRRGKIQESPPLLQDRCNDHYKAIPCRAISVDTGHCGHNRGIHVPSHIKLGCFGGTGRRCTGAVRPALGVDAAGGPVDYHAGTNRLLTSHGATAVLWDAATGLALDTMDIGGGALAVAFSGDGRRVLTASGGSPLRVWDVPTGEKIAEFDPPPRK